jgi:hypothetical protein
MGGEIVEITVEIDGTRHPAKCPYVDAEFVIVEGVCCPHETEAEKKLPEDKRTHGELFCVFGTAKHAEEHDTWAARAYCRACKQSVGTIRVKIKTIFGVEEDERVLNGRWRVY